MNNNFIESYYMSDLSICDDLINLFENSNNKILGETSDGVDKNIKDSLDLQLSIDDIPNSPALEAYFKELIQHLVFMTYLNDVKKGGETEWYYQKLKVKPKKGLTVIWGADWTFVHKGHTTFNEDKYIITGWFEFKK